MKSITYPTAEITASRVALGCMYMGVDWDPEESLTEEVKAAAVKAVEAAREADIDFFDHADMYTAGKSELAFAHAMKELKIDRDDIIIQSKCGIHMTYPPNPDFFGWFDFSYNHIMEAVNGSLKRLDIDYLDILLLHRPDMLAEYEEIARAFDDLQASGKVRAFGVSNFPPRLIETYTTVISQPFVASQMELNLKNTTLLDANLMTAGRVPEQAMTNAGALEYHMTRGMVTQVWRPLAAGYFSGRDLAGQDPKLAETAAVVREMAEKYSTSAEAILISWLLRIPANIQVMVGSSKPDRIRRSAAGTEITLEKEDWYRLYYAGRGRPPV